MYGRAGEVRAACRGFELNQKSRLDCSRIVIKCPGEMTEKEVVIAGVVVLAVAVAVEEAEIAAG